MRTRPADALYWATILSACTMGETLGDFISHGPLQLGYGWASVVLAALCLAAYLIERRSAGPSEARYWTTIVIMSTTGTTLADFVSRSLQLGYALSTFLLATLFAVTFVAWRRKVAEPSRSGSLPATDARYWAAIMVASTLGTTLGDFLSNGTRLGFGGGSLLLGALLAAVLIAERLAAGPNEARYWAALVVASTIGATTGDFITKEEGLNWGYGWGTAFLIALFVAVVLIGRRRRTS